MAPDANIGVNLKWPMAGAHLLIIVSAAAVSRVMEMLR
jgi:hypothetical protein